MSRGVMAEKGSSSPLPTVGMLAGLLLLGFAGVLVVNQVMPSTPEKTAAGGFLPRRLQGFGYITTSRAPSSFDSSDSSSSGSSSEPSKSSESGSLESSEWQHVSYEIMRALGSNMGWLTVSLLLQACFGIIYNMYTVESIIGDFGESPSIDNTGGTDFNVGMFACHKDLWVFCMGLCCPMVRMAHTNEVSGVCGFWESVFCWCCCAWVTLNIGPSCLLVWWRMRLKAFMKLEDNPPMDFCMTMICPLMSLCQMSASVDEAVGYKMRNVLWYDVTNPSLMTQDN